MAETEIYEWSNIWYEHAADEERPLVLIVGDSITVGYRSGVNSIFNGRVYAEAYSTSKSIDNPFYLEEMDLMIWQSKRCYDFIHFNCGLHGFHLSAEDYAPYYENAFKHILQNYFSAQLALVLLTRLRWLVNRENWMKKNNMIVERNEKVWEIAKKYHLPVNNLYSPMLHKPRLRKKDGYHYKSRGCRYQAEITVEFFLNIIKQY